MKLRYFCLFACVTLALAGCKNQKPQRTISDQRRAENLASFDQVWSTINEKHWDPKFNGVDWNAARDELRPKVEQAQTDAAARAAMEELIDRLKQSHFGIIPSEVYAKLDDLPKRTGDSAGVGVSGIQVRVVDGVPLVTKVESASAGDLAGVKPGWVVLRVGKRDVQGVLKRVRAAHEKSNLLGTYESMSVTNLLEGDAGATLAARFRDGQGRTVTKQLILKPPAGKPSKVMNLPTMYVTTEARKIDPNIGYIAFNIFMDPPTVSNFFRKSIEEFQNCDGLIIDLRGNPGGIGVMANGMAGSLVNQRDLMLGEMTMRTGSLKFSISPQPVLFAGPVAILIDECSMSTSEIMAGGLQDIGRVRVFGTQSPGAALPSRIDKLPNGDGFQYAFANYISAKGEVLEGKGVKPDQAVPPTRDALLGGRDPVIDAAAAWIAGQKK